MRIDRAEPTDGSDDDAYAIRRIQRAAKECDVAGKGNGKADDSSATSSSAHSGPAERTERTAAYRAKVAATNREHENDRGSADPDTHSNDQDQAAGSTSSKEKKTWQSPGESTAATQDETVRASHGTQTRNLTNPIIRSGKHDSTLRTTSLVAEFDLPEGYTSAPALVGDPYHPNSVAVRRAGTQELYTLTPRDRAAILGYISRIPAQKAPFDSHKQEVFTNGKNYITPDVDGHNVTEGWKMFSRRGVRIGTYDSELNYVKE